MKLKMKLNFALIGAAFASNCGKDLIDVGNRVSQGEIVYFERELMNFAVCAERELEPETFNEIFVEGGIFDGALVDFLNELFPNIDIPEYPGLPEVPDEGWRCMKEFATRFLECQKVINGPSCDEEDPAYNGISCGVRVFQCVLEGFSTLAEYCLTHDI